MATPWTSGRLEDIFDALNLLGRLALDAPHLDLGTEFLAAVVHAFFDGVPPVGAAIGDEDQPRPATPARGRRGPAGAVPALPSPDPPPQPLLRKDLEKMHATRTGRFSRRSQVILPGCFGVFRSMGLYHNRQTIVEKRLTHDRKT